MAGDLVARFIKTKVSLSMILYLIISKREKAHTGGKDSYTGVGWGIEQETSSSNQRALESENDQSLTVPLFRSGSLGRTDMPSSLTGFLLRIFFQIHSQNAGALHFA